MTTPPPDRHGDRADASYSVSVPRRTGRAFSGHGVRRARLYEAIPGQLPDIIGHADIYCGPGGPDGPARVTSTDGRLFETFGGWDERRGEWVASARQVAAPRDTTGTSGAEAGQ